MHRCAGPTKASRQARRQARWRWDAGDKTGRLTSARGFSRMSCAVASADRNDHQRRDDQAKPGVAVHPGGSPTRRAAPISPAARLCKESDGPSGELLPRDEPDNGRRRLRHRAPVCARRRQAIADAASAKGNDPAAGGAPFQRFQRSVRFIESDASWDSSSIT